MRTFAAALVCLPALACGNAFIDMTYRAPRSDAVLVTCLSTEQATNMTAYADPNVIAHQQWRISDAAGNFLQVDAWGGVGALGTGGEATLDLARISSDPDLCPLCLAGQRAGQPLTAQSGTATLRIPAAAGEPFTVTLQDAILRGPDGEACQQPAGTWSVPSQPWPCDALRLPDKGSTCYEEPRTGESKVLRCGAAENALLDMDCTAQNKRCRASQGVASTCAGE